MRCQFLLVLTSTLLMSCSSEIDSNDSDVSEHSVIPEKTSDIKKLKEPVYEIITNRNLEERLIAYGLENKETIVLIKTDKGDIKVRLYEDTPLHRASFILMAKNDCFNNTVFTRVVREFMAQAGGTYEEEMVDKRNAIGRYTIPAEIKGHHFHKQGVLGAARSYNNNPEKRSSPFAFYFVDGSLYNDLTLDKYEELNGYKFPKAHRDYYLKHKGAAHIDGEHTIFGEVIEGMEVIARLTNVKTGSQDWPVTDIFITEVIVIE